MLCHLVYGKRINDVASMAAFQGMCVAAKQQLVATKKV